LPGAKHQVSRAQHSGDQERALLDRVRPQLYPFEEPERRTEIAVNSIDLFMSLANGFKGPLF
jgi:hypothetical protein